jgi:hypothetical protein
MSKEVVTDLMHGSFKDHLIQKLIIRLFEVVVTLAILLQSLLDQLYHSKTESVESLFSMHVDGFAATRKRSKEDISADSATTRLAVALLPGRHKSERTKNNAEC